MSTLNDLRAELSAAVPEQWHGDPRKISLAYINNAKRAQQEARKVRQVASAVRLVRESLHTEMRRINRACIDELNELSAPIPDREFDEGLQAYLKRDDESMLRRHEEQNRRRDEARKRCDAAIEPCNALLADIERELHRLRDIGILIKEIEISA
jgi:hypothetical protein